MTLTIDLTPTEEVRLAAVAVREGLDPAEAAHKVLTANLPPVPDRRLDTGWEQERRLLEERDALLDREDAGMLSDAQATRLRAVEAQLDQLEDQDPVEQEADRRLAQTGDKLDEILALLRSLPRKEAEERDAGGDAR